MADKRFCAYNATRECNDTCTSWDEILFPPVMLRWNKYERNWEFVWSGDPKLTKYCHRTERPVEQGNYCVEIETDKT